MSGGWELVATEGRSESISGNCLPKTQVRANSQEDVYGLTPDQCEKVKRACRAWHAAFKNLELRSEF